MNKNEMVQTLEEMENITYYESNSNFQLLKKLLLATPENDADLKALTPYFLEQIIDLLLDCYNGDDLIKWLDKQDYDVIRDFRYADMCYKDDFDEDEWNDMKDDAMMYDEENEIIILSW